MILQSCDRLLALCTRHYRLELTNNKLPRRRYVFFIFAQDRRGAKLRRSGSFASSARRTRRRTGRMQITLCVTKPFNPLAISSNAYSNHAGKLPARPKSSRLKSTRSSALPI